MAAEIQPVDIEINGIVYRERISTPVKRQAHGQVDGNLEVNLDLPVDLKTDGFDFLAEVQGELAVEGEILFEEQIDTDNCRAVGYHLPGKPAGLAAEGRYPVGFQVLEESAQGRTAGPVVAVPGLPCPCRITQRDTGIAGESGIA